MATSGTYTFNLDTAHIIEEAYERIGQQSKTGNDLKTARRSLNLLLTKWVNDGVNLFTLDLTTTSLTKDVNNITLSASQYLDVLDGAIRDNSDTSNPQDIRLMTRLKYMPGHWGMHGFNRHPKLRNVNVSINLLQVSQMADSDSINLTEMGYDKLLGSGRIDRALNITVGSASARAIEKVEAAGGSVNLSDDDEDWEEWEEE